ncbi:MAG: T9SS type A sorting domain-containing protein [Clostridiaceae bacterium]|nr:T9SS type A sorting domain-containing protein [Clostridiaceae bacterium]
MKLICALFLITILTLLGYGQQVTLLTTLQDPIKETSGLIYLNQKIITHNDSGGEPALYELDSISGNVIRTVPISNATNIDWEDICFDSTYIYIGDFGNDGSRTDLKIYRLPISSYLTTANDTVTVDAIHFNYRDQTDFTPIPFSTNFDAEALISYNDSLYIFTKNWGDNWTNIYVLPKTPGTYQISKVDSINTQGLVSGATYNSVSNTILLIGYTFFSPFIIEISNFAFNEFSSGTIERYLIPPLPDFSFQMEGITSLNQNQYYITAEEIAPLKSALYRLNTDNLLGLEPIEEKTGLIYPNPTSKAVHIKYNDLSTLEIYDLQGVLQKTSSCEQTFIPDLRKGVYITIFKNSKGDKSVTQKLIIK